MASQITSFSLAANLAECLVSLVLSSDLSLMQLVT